MRTEVATTTQAGRDAESKTKLNIEFSDRNGVTYFEKLLMRKYRNGSMVHLHTAGPAERTVSTELQNEDEEESPQPVISEYNIFYDSEAMEVKTEDDSEAMELTSENVLNKAVFDDFGEHIIPSSVAIEELVPCTNDELISPSDSVETPNEEENPKECSVQKSGQTNKNSKRPREGGNSSNKKLKPDKMMIELLASDHKEKNTELEECGVHHCSQADLLESVKSLWANCTQSDHNQQLMKFFLHRVKPKDSEDVPATQPPNTEEDTPAPTKFKMGSTMWLPSSSLLQTTRENPHNVTDDVDDNTTTTSYTSRPNTGERKDLYYDDTDSDSEPENERREFISSRLGTASCMEGGESRATSSLQDLEEEREKADNEALQDLACELASTVECEGRLTSCKGDLDQLDLEGGTEHDLATPLHSSANEEGQGEWSSNNVGEVDMAKVVSEFELYQRELIEQESDSEQ